MMKDTHGDNFQMVHVVRLVNLQTTKSGKGYSAEQITLL